MPVPRTSDSLERRLERIVMQFLDAQMGIRPAAVAVHLRPGVLEASLSGVLSAAERTSLRDRYMGELLSRSCASAFRHVRTVLESSVAEALGRPVAGATFTLDPESDSATVRISLDQ